MSSSDNSDHSDSGSSSSSSSSSSGTNSDSSSSSEDEKTRVQKKTNKRKKPTGPKKAVTSFMYYAKDARAQIKADNPEASFAAIGKLLGEAWRALTPEEKAPYVKLNEADKARYLKDLQAADPATLSAANRKRLKKEAGGPRRPLSSYMFFSRDNRTIVQKENPEAKFAQVGKLLGQKWKGMNKEEKQPYLDMAGQDKIRYQTENAAFQAKIQAAKAEKDAEEAKMEAAAEAERDSPSDASPKAENLESDGEPSQDSDGDDSDSGSDADTE